WKFSLPDDLVQYTDQELATLPTAHDFKDTLQVVRGPAGTDVFVVDAGRKRKIDAAVLRAWRIVPSAAKVLTASEFGAIPDGDAFTKRPELAKGEGDKVYLLDTSLLDPAVPGAASDAGSSGGGDAGVGSDEDPSQVNPDCGCKVLVAHNATLNPRLVVAGLFALVALRRRRSPRRV
nr:hypothetical protein [Polyangiaceae bacterium]